MTAARAIPAFYDLVMVEVDLRRLSARTREISDLRRLRNAGQPSLERLQPFRQPLLLRREGTSGRQPQNDQQPQCPKLHCALRNSSRRRFGVCFASLITIRYCAFKSPIAIAIAVFSAGGVAPVNRMTSWKRVSASLIASLSAAV